MNSDTQPEDMVSVPLSLIQRAQQAINWHLEPTSPAEHNATMLELSAIGWPDSVPPTQAPAPGESYDDLVNALHRIDTAAVFLPGFEVRHEGGLDAVVQNIVEAIGRCADQAPAVGDERAAFEATARDHGLPVTGDHGRYDDPYTDWAWSAWQWRAEAGSRPPVQEIK